MTIIAGIISLQKDKEIPLSLKNCLRRHLTRSRVGKREEYEECSVFITKWDCSAFSDPAWNIDLSRTVSGLAGDPILRESAGVSRTEQLEQLSAIEIADLPALLASSRGSFSLVRYSPGDRHLIVATDAIGLRSMYYTSRNGLLVFASTLRILESLAELKLDVSYEGLAEQSVFGFPLANRTPYDDVFILRESEYLDLRGESFAVRSYQTWSDTKAPLFTTPETAASNLHEEFQRAVKLRMGMDRVTYAFLSGGMDSRAIVSSLISQECHVEALNFSPDGSQDQRYGQMFADTVGPNCRLHCYPREGNPNFSVLASEAILSLERTGDAKVDRPRFIWSGDGGSVGLGHVYMDDIAVALGSEKRFDEAARHLMKFNKWVFPRRVLATQHQKLPQKLLGNVVKEIERYPRSDPARQIYLFLMFNDQRRHLFKHMESIDLHGLELLTPFFDTVFLQSVAAIPTDWGIYHRLYAKWFAHLPAFSRSTPWQTYPDHEPCPVKPSVDGALSYQWDRRTMTSPRSVRFAAASGIVKKGFLLRNISIFSTSRLLIAALGHALGLRDAGHIHKTLTIYLHHVKRESGGCPT